MHKLTHSLEDTTTEREGAARLMLETALSRVAALGVIVYDCNAAPIDASTFNLIAGDEPTPHGDPVRFGARRAAWARDHAGRWL